jgi:hypothetical protein
MENRATASDMITIAECRAVAAEKLMRAEATPQRRHVLMASADRWTLLASRLLEVDAATTGLRAAVMAAAVDPTTSYRGYKFSVVQASNSMGWRWTVHNEGAFKETGHHFKSEFAIRAAISAIDKSIARAERVGLALETMGVNNIRDLVAEIEAEAAKPKH